MAKLSAKQQKNLERKWELEAQEFKIMVAMANAIRGLVEQKKVLRAEIDALEDQVPESVQDAWDREDEDNSLLGVWESPEDRKEWREAYDLVKKASGN